MNSDKLARARRYEKEYGEQIHPEDRPMFHVTPTVGWMNDPNGFSVYKGEYHLFYQYYPYDVKWGAMHWGHVKSKDLINWERLPAAMAPDEEYDGQGCFSGSAIELPDGRHMLLYTGVQGTDNTPQCRQTQCIAYGDGIEYKKFENNPVITADMLPDGCSASDFRDPKVWWEESENCFCAVAGVRTEDGSGAIVLFKSPDGSSWEYTAMLDRSRNEYGKMWECPDMFELDGKTILITSPQEMLAKDLEFHNGNDVICLVGDYDRTAHTFSREKVTAVDYGLDFYAPQTVKAPDGRRILIGWMQAWENSHLHPVGAKWTGMFTIPRELYYRDGRLIQTPVRELEAYRANPVIHTSIGLNGRMTLPGISGRTLDMTVTLRPADLRETLPKFTMNIAENDTFRTTFTFDPKEDTVSIDRTASGYPYNIISVRKAPVSVSGGKLKLRLILDRFCAELFINDGQQVMSACLYTPQEADSISFETDNAAILDVEKYEILL